MEYSELFRSLYENDIKYLLCGGLAVNIYGISRMTADIDILIDFEKGNLEKLEQVLENISYKPHLPIPIRKLEVLADRRKLIEERNLIAYSYYNATVDYLSLDVLVDVPLSFGDLWERKEARPLDDFMVYIVALDDLIALKKYANRIQDQEDVKLLTRLRDER
jgi:predicted nucleotidyltransferase